MSNILLIQTSCLFRHLHDVVWNGYNKAKRQSKASDYDNFLKLAPAPAPAPAPYRSWPEFHIFNNTLLKHAEYEPMSTKSNTLFRISISLMRFQI